MSLTIKHPDADFTGEHSGLVFTDGVAELAALEEEARGPLLDNGFTIEGEDDEIVTVEVVEVEAPTDKWTHEQIDEFAAKFEIDLGDATKKDAKLAAIAKVIEERTAAAEASGTLQ
ncbi:hypothetical protein [Microbacterium aoyamense]|nr:hypothetical protein [Microbacterium aoyamense]